MVWFYCKSAKIKAKHAIKMALNWFLKKEIEISPHQESNSTTLKAVQASSFMQRLAQQYINFQLHSHTKTCDSACKPLSHPINSLYIIVVLFAPTQTQTLNCLLSSLLRQHGWVSSSRTISSAKSSLKCSSSSAGNRNQFSSNLI